MIDYLIRLIYSACMSKKLKGLENEKKCLILSVATRLFAKDGFKAVSIREISKASECNVASISYHFGGKEKLYAQCLKNTGIFKAKLSCCLKHPSNASELHEYLNLFCLSFCKLISEKPEVIRLTLQELNTNLGEESFSETFLVCLSEELSGFFQSGIEKNLLPSEFRPELSARFLIGGLIFHKLYFNSDEYFPDKEIVSHLIRNSTWSMYA